MTVLVLSDSHSALRFMRQCVDFLNPDIIIHLGDYFEDGEALKEIYPCIPFYQVSGNCDKYRCIPSQPEILVEKIGGICVYLTHGHRHKVKLTRGLLLKDARAAAADIALYGHTHQADCCQEDDGLWVLNPGTCGHDGGSAGVIEIAMGKILSCRIIRQADLLETNR